MSGKNARKRHYQYVCPKCGWVGKRRGKVSDKPCPMPECGGIPHVHLRGIGRPAKPGGKPIPYVPNPDIVHGGYTSQEAVRTACTKPLIDSIASKVRTSKCHLETAAIASGVPKPTWEGWVRRGRDDIQNNHGSIFAELVRVTEKARAEGEVDLLEQAEDLAKGNKASWMRTYRHLESWSKDRWVKTDRVELEAKLVDVETVPDAPNGIDGFLGRALKQGDAAHILQDRAVDAEYRELPGASEAFADRGTDVLQEPKSVQASIGRDSVTERTDSESEASDSTADGGKSASKAGSEPPQLER